MASPWTSTHPQNAYQPSSMTEGSFKSSLRSALINSRSKASPSYRSVRVLLMFWHHTCHGTYGEEQDYTTSELVFQLAKVFRESSRYFVQIQYLGCHCKSSPSLSPRQGDLSTDNDIIENDSLVIIYYIGYGRILNNDLYICSSEERRQKDINFTRDVASGFANSDSAADTLLLLDCHTGGGVFNNNSIIPDTGAGTIHEVIASTAPDTDDWSFTRNLIRELQHAAETKEILTTPRLYARLAIASLYPQDKITCPESSPGDVPANSSLPIHLHNLYHSQNHPRTSTGTIHLPPPSPNKPRRPPQTPLLLPGSNTLYVAQSKSWTAAPYPLLLLSPATVLISVNIQSATASATMQGQGRSQEQDHFTIQKSLQDWAYKRRPAHYQSQAQSQPQARSSPSPHQEEEVPAAPIDSVDRIRISTSYQSSPSTSTILFEVPFDVWDTLPPSPAIQFLTVTTKPVITQQQQPQPRVSESESSSRSSCSGRSRGRSRSRRPSPQAGAATTKESPRSSLSGSRYTGSHGSANASAGSQEDNLLPGPKERPDERGSSNTPNNQTRLPDQPDKSKSRSQQKNKRISWTSLVTKLGDSSAHTNLITIGLLVRVTKRLFPTKTEKGEYTKLETPPASEK